MPGRPTTIDATTALPEPAGTPPDDSWTAVRGPFWHVVRAGTALGWLLLVAAVLVTGERVTSVDTLLAAAARGDVDEVRVAGHILPPGARGSVTQELHWSDGEEITPDIIGVIERQISAYSPFQVYAKALNPSSHSSTSTITTAIV